MSQPILPYDVWPQQIVQASVPANSNALRSQVLSSSAVSAEVSSQPASPEEGDVYILPASPTGAAWSLFEADDLAIFTRGSWFAFSPVEGIRIPIGVQQYIYSGSAGWVPFSETSSSWGSIIGNIEDQSDLQSALGSKLESVQAGTNVTIDATDPQNPIINATGGGGASVWGAITGTISDQTDLQSALDEKIEGVSWGDVTGSLSDQTDLNSALESKLESIQAGTNVSVDDTDPKNPILSASFTPSWGDIEGTLSDQTDLQNALSSKLESIQAGTNVTIDATDPQNPIINATGGGGGSSAWGSITGTLSDQTDLQSALDAKPTTFTGLSDTPNNYTNAYFMSVRVNGNADGLEFGDVISVSNLIGGPTDDVSGAFVGFTDANLQVDYVFDGDSCMFTGKIFVKDVVVDSFGSTVGSTGELAAIEFLICVAWDPNALDHVIKHSDFNVLYADPSMSTLSFTPSLGAHGGYYRPIQITLNPIAGMALVATGSIRRD